MAVAVGRKLGLDPLSLSRCELVHAAIERVVHEVVDGIEAWLVRARVASDGAPTGRASLRRGIVDLISSRPTPALERMVQPDPMPGFVRQSVAQVEVFGRASWDGRVQDDNTVVLRVALILARESGVAKQTLGIAVFKPNGVNVKRRRSALPQRLLHSSLLGVLGRDAREPLGLIEPRHLLQIELHARRAVRSVENINLLVHSRIGDISTSDGVILHNNMEVNVQGPRLVRLSALEVPERPELALKGLLDLVSQGAGTSSALERRNGLCSGEGRGIEHDGGRDDGKQTHCYSRVGRKEE